jgi:hypothetical protein
MLPSAEVYMTKQPKLEVSQSAFIEKIMPDPSNPGSVTPWLRLVGKSSEDAYRQLYLTLKLDTYIKFQEQDELAYDRLAHPHTISAVSGVMNPKRTLLRHC